MIRELGSDHPQARSQALHTLSKVRDPSAYPSITRVLLRDPNDGVAQSAWRAAVVLVPELQKGRLA
ncbi:MAG: HEAT repeat domain-containing protein [Gammaproteobacteria bacterium]